MALMIYSPHLTRPVTKVCALLNITYRHTSCIVKVPKGHKCPDQNSEAQNVPVK